MESFSIECEGTLYPAVRTDGQIVESIVLELEHLQTAHRARLIGICHYGLPEYYEQIQQLLDSRPASKILEENVSLPSTVDDSDELASNVHGHIASLIEIRSLFIESTNGVIVSDTLKFPEERLVESDVEFEELVDAIEDVKSKELQGSVSGLYVNFFGKSFKIMGLDTLIPWGMKMPLLRYYVRSVLREAFHHSFFEEAKMILDDHAIRVDLRNKKALRIAEKESESGDIEIPWGARHIPGIVRGLLETGDWKINPESIQYLTYYDAAKLMKPFELQAFGSGKGYAPTF